MRKNIIKWLLLGVGSLSVFIGFIGLIVPIMPTLPFLIIGAACYVKSSERFYKWLISHRYFGNDIKNFIEHRMISKKSKVFSIVFLGLAMGTSIGFIVPRLPLNFITWVTNPSIVLQILLGVITAGVMVYILSLNTVNTEQS